MAKPKIFFEYLKLLSNKNSGSPLLSEGERFDASLKAAISSLQDFIKTSASQPEDVKDMLIRFFDELSSLEDIRWSYTLINLQILLMLHQYFIKELEGFNTKKNIRQKLLQNPDLEAPRLSPDALSITQQKDVERTLQFVVILGVCGYLEEGVGMPLDLRTGFSKLIKQSTRDLSDKVRIERMFVVIKTMLTCSSVPSLGGVILTKHFGDILPSLLQVCQKTDLDKGKQHENTSMQDVKQNQEESLPSKDSNPSSSGEGSLPNVMDFTQIPPEEQLNYCQKQLGSLLSRTYQPLVFRQLLLLQGGPGSSRTQSQNKNPLPRPPSWLSKTCGQLVMEHIMSLKGVQYLLRAVLDVAGTAASDDPKADTLDWQRCEAVAKLIVHCPPYCQRPRNYFRTVCPQILELLHFKDQLILKQVLRVCCTCMETMVTEHYEVALHLLIAPLLKPLLSLVKAEALPDVTEPVLFIPEVELTLCLEDVHKVFIQGREPSPTLLQTLLPVLHPLYCLYGDTKGSVFHLRNSVEEILLTVLKSTEKSSCLGILCHLGAGMAYQGGGMDGLTLLTNGMTFTSGSSGGIMVMYHPDQSSDEMFTHCVLSSEQAASCIADLLLKLKRDDVTADFFIKLLQELTTVLSRKSASSDKSNEPDQVLLQIESTQREELDHIQHSLRVFSLVSCMAEQFGNAILESVEHMIAFARATLERACSSLEDDVEVAQAFEVETLMLSFGLVSAIISGEAKKPVTREHRSSLMALLPLLERLAEEYPMETVHQMASDLRIAIATHGAVWSENMNDILVSLRKKTEKRTNSTSGTNSTDNFIQMSLSKDSDAKDQVVRDENFDEGKSLSHQKKHQGTQTTSDKGTSISSTSSALKDHEKAKENVKASIEMVKSEEFDQAMKDLFDPLVPVRGHALMVISKLLEQQDKTALQKQDFLLKVLQENLVHEDTYIYLSAINGLVALADRSPATVIPILCNEFSAREKGSILKMKVETRLKLGEALMKATRMLGDLAPHYSKSLLNAFISGSRDPDPHVRASSLSNLGEICKLLRFSLGPIVQEVLHCLSLIMQTDKEAEVRRACVLVICLIFKGLGADTLKVLETDIRDIYRFLKQVYSSEKDEVVRLHTQLALEELESIMRKFLFPQQTLTKKITVLP